MAAKDPGDPGERRPVRRGAGGSRPGGDGAARRRDRRGRDPGRSREQKPVGVMELFTAFNKFLDSLQVVLDL